MNMKALNGDIAAPRSRSSVDPRLQDVGDRPERLDRLRPYRAVIARVRRVQHREALRMLLPIEVSAVDDDAADRGAVAADIFRRRVHGDGGAMPDRLAQHRASRVVHDQRHAEFPADFGDFGDWKHRELGVGQRFAVVAPGLRVGGAAEILGVGGIDEAALDAHRTQGVLEQIPGAAIDIRGADEIVAGMADVLHREQRGGLA